MRRFALMVAAPAVFFAAPALAASQSSNSSSNSSNGVTTRVDTYSTIEDDGRRTFRQRVYRERVVPQRGWRRDRAWRGRDRDDD